MMTIVGKNKKTRSAAARLTRPDGSNGSPATAALSFFRQQRQQAQAAVIKSVHRPVTILNWSFFRIDQPRFETCYQIALAIKDEVEDLEKAGITVIQMDEAALREGLPLRNSEHAFYLDWAVHSFRITNVGVQDTIQIHTHMCLLKLQ